MIRKATRVLAVVALPAALVVGGATALAKHEHSNTSQGTPTLSGNAVYNTAGALLTSNSTAPGYGSLSLPISSGMTLSSISALDATYQMTAGDCGGGSPRFSITLANGANIFAYFGQAPNYNSCANGVQSQSNLLQPNVDTSQLTGGTFYDTWAHALQLAGSQQVTGVSIVVDGGWMFPSTGQAASIQQASINGTEFSFTGPTSANQCKKGGWKSFVNPTFKNQGQCVSYAEHQKSHGDSDEGNGGSENDNSQGGDD